MKSGEQRLSLEKLLPDGEEGVAVAKRLNHAQSDLAFKAYVIVSMTCLWTGYTLLVRYTRSTTPSVDMYNATTVVFLAECAKLLLTVVFLFKENNWSYRDTKMLLDREFFGKPIELAKMSVPSIAYALQNNLDFVALSYLSAGVYQVTTQLKVVTTAIFMIIFLGRKFSSRRWVAIVLLFCGVAAVQLNNVNETSSSGTEKPLVGLIAVLCTCATAGFAGVYFEMMLKDGSSTPFWVRNLQMYSCGVLSALMGILVSDWDRIRSTGFLHGYTTQVWLIIGFLSVGGIYISLVMKHLDNLHKSFASAVSIILVVVISLFLFDNIHIGIFFVLGSATVCGAILLYNSVNE